MKNEQQPEAPAALAVRDAAPMAILGQMDLSAIDPDKVEKLLDLQRQWESDNAKREYNEALTRFQGECPRVGKTAQGHNSKYAKFEDIKKLAGPFLQAHGFTDTYDTTVNADGVLTAVTCHLRHVSGHTESATFPTHADPSGSKNAIQAIKSGITYGKRCALELVSGIVTCDEDDDGQAVASPELVSEDQAADLAVLVSDLKALDAQKVLAFFRYVGVASVAQIPAARFDECADMLRRGIRKEEGETV